MKLSKRLVGVVSILLALCLLPIFGGCGLILYTEENPIKTTAQTTHGAMTTAPAYTTGGVYPEAELIDPALKEAAKKRLDKVFSLDMSGSTLLVTVANETKNTVLPAEDSPFYSACKERNEMITGKLGCDFYTMSASVEQMRTDLAVSIKSGSTSSYYADLVLIPSTYAAIFAAEDLILDLRSLPFYSVATEGNVGAGYYNGKSYFDLSAATESPELVYALYFNRDMADTAGAQELYSAAREGTLTFDYFFAFCERSAVPEGKYSLTVGGEHDSDAFLGDIAAIRGGIDFVSGKSGGYPQLAYSDSAVEAAGGVIGLLRNLALYLPSAELPKVEALIAADGTDTSAAPEGSTSAAVTGAEQFAKGNSLFHMGTLSEMSNFYNQRTAWGVLPLPTLSGEAPAVMSQDRGVFCVTANNSRPDMMGAILPAFAAASGEWMDGEYAVYCAENYIRDNDSFHMIKLILSQENYADFSYLHYQNCEKLESGTFGAFRGALLGGSTPLENIKAVVNNVNKALKKIKY